MKKKRTVLVVDDSLVNRLLLKKILCDDYEVLEAENGKTALSLLEDDPENFSAVLLDIMMPVMNGYETLERIRKSDTLCQVPVIVTTGNTEEGAEIKALSMGANDFIIKPYDPEIIRHRLWNTVNLRETAAVANMAERDMLTGVYNRNAFFRRAEKMIAEKEPGYYVLSCLDIDNFKVINDQFGSAEGDKALCHVAEVFDQGVRRVDGIFGRITADIFVALYPKDIIATGRISKIREQASNLGGAFPTVTISTGRYIVEDKSLTVSAMYDRATLAEEANKGRFDTKVTVYDESMRVRLLKEQEIIYDMKNALLNEEFEVWFQPQYSLATEALIGAEALVRWRHPRRGLIPPNEFIPVFERIGFIYELDRYVWERSCMLLRKWKDEGRSPLPLSVNVSRYDIFCEDLFDVLSGLIKKYDLDVSQLRLEITESAFAKSTAEIIKVVQVLVDYGFTLEIDDFGSGYSSLNALKDVPADVLKLDMNFLENEGNSERGGNILESIVRMAKWLGMSVIAEGVEVKEEADFLKTIGCDYVQGYLYARPMTEADYEALAKGITKEDKMMVMETVETFDNSVFWDPKSMETLIFNSYVGGACIFEWNDGKVDILRANKKYAHTLLGCNASIGEALTISWNEWLDTENIEKIFQTISRAEKTNDEAECEIIFNNLRVDVEQVYLRVTMRIIANSGSRLLVYCSVLDFTAQRNAEKKERQIGEQLKVIMKNVAGGISASIYSEDSLHYLFTNDYYHEMFGYTKEQFTQELSRGFLDLVHVDDMDIINDIVREEVNGKKTITAELRVYRRDGSLIWVRRNGSVVKMDGIAEPVHISVCYDVTEKHRTDARIQFLNDSMTTLMEDAPGGFARMKVHGNGMATTEYINEGLCALRGMSYDEIITAEQVDAMFYTHPDDVDMVLHAVRDLIATGESNHLQFRVRHGHGGYIRLMVYGRATTNAAGEIFLNLYYAEPTKEEQQEMNYREMLSVALAAMMSASTDLSFVKDKELNYICCSHAFAMMTGLKDEKEVVGKTDFDLFDKELAEKYRADDKKLINSGKSIVDHVEAIPSEDDKIHYSSTSKYLLYDADGDVIGLYGTGRDITENREAYAQLKLLTDNIPGGLATFALTNDGISMVFFNDGFYNYSGYSKEEYTEKTKNDPFFFIFEEDMVQLHRLFVFLRNNDGEAASCTFRCHTKDGGFRRFSMKASVSDKSEDYRIVNAVKFDITDQIEIEKNLRIREEEFHAAVKQSGRSMARYDIKNKIYYNENQELFFFGFGKEINNVPQSFIDAGIIAPSSVEATEKFFREMSEGKLFCRGEFALKQRDESYRWYQSEATVVFDEEQQPSMAVIVFFDITEEREKEIIYKKWQQSLDMRPHNTYTLFRCNLSKKASFDVMEGSLLKVNFDPEEQSFDGRTKEYVEQCVYEEDKEKYLTFLDSDTLLANYYRGKHTALLEYRETDDAGNLRWIRLSVEMVEYPNSGETEVYLMYENIDKEKKAALLTKYQAENDGLTGLLNRSAFIARVEALFKDSEEDAQHALLLIDIDGFKAINDRLGHNAGDQELVRIAYLIQSTLRKDDIVGRLGGDEFIICLKNMQRDAVVEDRAANLCSLLRRRISEEVSISASIGMVIYPRDGKDFDTLFHKADIALYDVKNAGKDDYSFYFDKMEDEPVQIVKESIFTPPHYEQKRRMLIVEDNTIDYSILENIFRDDYLIDWAKDGNAALIRLRHYGASVSVILLDINMPVMNGFETMKKMRESVDVQMIPIVVVSANDDRETFLQAIEMGAAEIVTKPVDVDFIRFKVSAAVRKSENERSRIEKNYLLLRNGEISKYRAVLQYAGIAVAELDWVGGSFTYDPDISLYLDGNYDGRRLWHILLSDMVATVMDVKDMQALVHDIAMDRDRRHGEMEVILKTPSGKKHHFRMEVIKTVNEYKLTDKMIITFMDLDREESVQQ